MTASLIETPRTGIRTESMPPESAFLERHGAKGRTALGKAEIAQLSLGDIRRMSSRELIRVIRAASVLLPQPDVESRVEFRDRPTLERLACVARRCCRNQGY